MKIIDNIVAQSVILALILSIPMLFADGVPGSKRTPTDAPASINPELTSETPATTQNTSSASTNPSSTAQAANEGDRSVPNTEPVHVPEPEQQEIQGLKDAFQSTQLTNASSKSNKIAQKN
ncbi:hypothetical protein NT6N_35600 [Oceaniferula spumae]|uniref:Uncharacterized protein n=1 Tax=Oceaniferula spumae TaxID=2979115 RepID=A0AAT9FR81_9BACT